MARGRFSMPAASMSHGRHWTPFHAIVAAPLLVAFELLLCEHLESGRAVNLKIVFLPLLALEILVLVDNIWMCRALIPQYEETISGETIRETLPHFCIALSMFFFLTATAFTLLKLSGDVAGLGWWDLFVNYCVAECFVFLVSTKWYAPSSQRLSDIAAATSSSAESRYLETQNTLLGPDPPQNITLRRIRDIGIYLVAILFLVFEGTPPGAKNIPIPVIFSPLLLLQGCWFLYTVYMIFGNISQLIHHGTGFRLHLSSYSNVGFFGCWSIDERSEHSHLYSEGETRYNTFSPDEVQKMAKSDLIEEIKRLQSALALQKTSTMNFREEVEKLETEKIKCQVCFDKRINVVLLPCRHHILCSNCSVKCSKCPICRVSIGERLAVNEVW
ncbi:hypothetical protein M569_16842 [Genlisea aurea]|uniref:RING-type domain-containing protein n=1 Tax=Genlisea aurea TaxID=192259 RepID=S8BTR2_9LAMI|nr:hypothetical protein M569_16842 [Genlisea aurea]